MGPALRALLDGLRERGDAPCMLLEDHALSAGALLEAVRTCEARIARASTHLAAGDVVGVEAAPGAGVPALLAAWRLGLSTYILSPREPAGHVPALAAEAGCRLLLGQGATGELDVAVLPGPRALAHGPWTLLRTTGSSGAPKIAVHAIEAHLASARAAATFFGLDAGDTWLLALPHHHVGGLGVVLRCLVAGARLAVPAPNTSTARALAHFGPTHVSLVPTQLRRLLADAAATRRLAACRAVLLGGDRLPASLRAEALDRGVPLVVSYGSTETAALVAASADAAVARKARSAGRPLPQRTVRIAADGEILVGAPTLLSGYLRDGRVEDPKGPDGLLATGDLGRFDEHGVLYVEGRKDRLFVSGGENVQPEEIEAVLEMLDGVVAAVVVPVEHADFGHRPVAFVDGRAEVLDGDLLRARLRALLPGFKVPDAFYAWARSAADAGRLKPSPARLAARLRSHPTSLRRL